MAQECLADSLSEQDASRHDGAADRAVWGLTKQHPDVGDLSHVVDPNGYGIDIDERNLATDGIQGFGVQPIRARIDAVGHGVSSDDPCSLSQKTRGSCAHPSNECQDGGMATTRRDTSAVVLGLFILGAGITHFLNPTFFDAIVPPWMPFGERFWTIASGIAEIVIGVGVLRRSTRKTAALAAFVLFLAVYPANLYMAWDWRDRALSEQLVSIGRLPFQFLFFAWALKVARGADQTGHTTY